MPVRQKQWKILVTGGSPQTRVGNLFVLSNQFQESPGDQIATDFAKEGHDVTLLTASRDPISFPEGKKLSVVRCSERELFEKQFEQCIRKGKFDVVIHTAILSEFRFDQLLQPRLNLPMGEKHLTPLSSTAMLDELPGYVFIRCEHTDSLLNQIRQNWGFTGFLVGLVIGDAREADDDTNDFGTMCEREIAKLVHLSQRKLHVSYANLILGRTPTEGMYIVVSDERVEHSWQPSILSQAIVPFLKPDAEPDIRR